MSKEEVEDGELYSCLLHQGTLLGRDSLPLPSFSFHDDDEDDSGVREGREDGWRQWELWIPLELAVVAHLQMEEDHCEAYWTGAEAYPDDVFQMARRE